MKDYFGNTIKVGDMASMVSDGGDLDYAVCRVDALRVDGYCVINFVNAKSVHYALTAGLVIKSDWIAVKSSSLLTREY